MADSDGKSKSKAQLQDTLMGFPSFSPKDLARKCPDCEQTVLPPDMKCPFCGAEMPADESKE